MLRMLKMLVVLPALCALSGFALSYLKIVTAPRIEEQILENVQGPALTRVFAQVQNFPIEERRSFTLEDKSVVTVFPARLDGKLVGAALEQFGQGYGGDIGVIVGFNLDNDSLTGIGITTMKETPGLGTRVAQPNFYGQFAGKKAPLKLAAEGGAIDGISGSTVSSQAVIAAVNKAEKIYHKLKPQLAEAFGAGPAAPVEAGAPPQR